ncbi:MAG: hypothetical protein J7M30_16320, partial [Deltaproteobacteria bacterium]|nr:hypothetical protein [Deltaproteobacteria bacterium]
PRKFPFGKVGHRADRKGGHGGPPYDGIQEKPKKILTRLLLSRYLQAKDIPRRIQNKFQITNLK